MCKLRAAFFKLSFLVLATFLLFSSSCASKTSQKKTIELEKSPSPSEGIVTTNTSKPVSPSPEKSGDGVDIGELDIELESGSGVIPRIKSDGFSQAEMEEIKKDGLLSYYYRRKYSREEIGIVWKAVNELLSDYSRKDKLIATRSILAYHWVVYRTTPTHHMGANVLIAKRYRNLMKEKAKLHQIPAAMLEGIITWENSGGIARKSWAECVGLGQLSWGAVRTAHQFYVPYVKKQTRLAGTYREMGDFFNMPLLNAFSKNCLLEAEIYDIASRHKKLKAVAGVEDERVIPECNVEDAAIYLKLLYNNYANRMDLAISAYHNGGQNNNDVIRDYLNRKHKAGLTRDSEQKEIIAAIERTNLSYIDLWKDNRSRDMLNGLRTVFGEPTTHLNQRLAMGDESDIYLWKIVAAYAALDAPAKTLLGLVEKYRGDWDVAETRGLKRYQSISQIREAIKSGMLVPLPGVYIDCGIGDIKGGSRAYYKDRYRFNYYVLPETAGFLLKLAEVYRNRSKNPRLKIPIRAALQSKVLEKYEPGSIPEDYHTHLQGVSLDINLEKADRPKLLRLILKEGFLHDKIYIVMKKGVYRVTVNPRYGKHFYKFYLKHR